MQEVWGSLVICTVCPLLGSLPLIDWLSYGFTGQKLSQMGTGNVSVSAAFYHGGRGLGIAAVCSEALKGIFAILLTRLFFPPGSVWELMALIGVVIGRYWGGKGAGVTNVVWGLLLHDPMGTGVMIILSAISFTLWRDRSSGRLAALFWMVVILSVRHSLTDGYWIGVLSLAGLLATISQKIPDDLDLDLDKANPETKKMFRFFQGDRAILTLNQRLDPQKVGNKAANLAYLKRLGYTVADGWILPPGDDPQTLVQWLNPSPQEPLIVRSSALGEDSENASGAGQYTSILNVTNRDSLEEAIGICQGSYNQSHAVRYRQDLGQPEQAIAVLIQKQIQGVFSGVAFSRDPVNPLREDVVIEALPGSASQVVSGKKTPHQYRVFLAETATVTGEGDIPLQLIESVARLTRELESLYHGLPQDLEWSYDGDQLWVLQLRPITTLKPIWTRKIAAEVIPGVIRPLTWSINRPLTCGVWGEIFTLVLGKGSEDLDFQETATLHYQRAYFNATLLGTIFRRMGLPPESLEFLTRGAKFTKPSLITTIKNLPNLLGLARREWTLEKDFGRDNQDYFSPLLQELKGQDLSPLSASELLQGIEDILKVLKKATYYSILCPLSLAIRQGLSKVSLEELDNSLAPEVASVRSLQYLATEARNILNPELIEEKNILSLLAENPAGQAVLQGFNEWLETYGYLSDAATDIAVPRWREDPTSAQELFNQFFAREQKSTNPKHSQFKNLQKRLDLKNTSTTIYSQLLAHLRWHFVALEKRLISTNILRETGDIFFLTYPEIVELVTSKNLSVDILSRRQEFRQNQQIESVPRVIYGNSPYLESYVVSQSSEKKLQGIGASSGQVEGRIKVLKNLQQIDKIEENTILVVPYTDSGWAPWLCQAVGIISEVGGSLSHGAIVAREYGIPAVMDIHNATNILRNGQRVRIDGQRGIVEII